MSSTRKKSWHVNFLHGTRRHGLSKDDDDAELEKKDEKRTTEKDDSELEKRTLPPHATELETRTHAHAHALIILNQPFSRALLRRLWASARWRCCADGGANRLFDAFTAAATGDDEEEGRMVYLPDLIKGDLDSIRADVRAYYAAQGVRIVQDHDQNTTDLMKCVAALEELEQAEARAVTDQYPLVLLGGLSGRLDQTVHTLSYLHKLRKTRSAVFAVTDENIGWVLDEGEHEITIEHAVMGQTCGILPVGVDSTVLSTTGLKWNLTDAESGFDGLVSTSNHLVPDEKVVWIRTSRPVWWTAELKNID